MADDFYQVLGLKRDASKEQIQKAYRDLARKYHPDLHPDDKGAKEKFQKVQAAFDVLNDPDKKAKYDRFGSAYDSAGSGYRGSPFTWTTGGEGAGGGAGFEEVDLSEIFGGGGGAGGFADILKGFGRGSGGRTSGSARTNRPSRRGRDLTYELQVPFNTAILGGEAAISVQRDGKTERISVKIPAGIEDGKKIRLRGQGEPGGRGGEPGDILIAVKVASHPHFQRRGKHLDVEVPVTLAEAALGAKIDVPTPKGTITLSIPPGTSSGKRLRIKGHGVEAQGEAGDLYAEIQIVLPDDLDVEDLKVFKKMMEKHPANPRADLRW